MSTFSTTFIIDGSCLESFGNFVVIQDTYFQQTALSQYALLTFGLCRRADEQWAPSFTLISTSWTGFTLPTTTWTYI